MTVQDVIDRLFTAKGQATERVTKAQGLASRHKLEWSAVLAAMSPEQRALMEPQ